MAHKQVNRLGRIRSHECHHLPFEYSWNVLATHLDCLPLCHMHCTPGPSGSAYQKHSSISIIYTLDLPTASPVDFV